MMNAARSLKDEVGNKQHYMNEHRSHAIMKALCVLLSLVVLLPTVTAYDNESEDTIITVDSTNLRFSPSSVTIEEGQTIRFFWSGQALPHNAVERNGVFDSGDPQRNVNYSFTFERGMNGTYEFVCEPHEAFGMVGTITVTPLPPEEPKEENDSNMTTTPNENTPFLSSPMTILSIVSAAVVLRRDSKLIENGVLVERKEDHC
jgi:plastocyanin